MLPERQRNYLYQELGVNIKKLREEKGYGQSEFAGLLTISRASLVNIEKGRQHPPLHNLYEIARLLGIPLPELLPDLSQQIEIDIDPSIEKQIEKIAVNGDSSSDKSLELQKKLLEFVRTQQSTNSK